jgi:hypothetical protein
MSEPWPVRVPDPQSEPEFKESTGIFERAAHNESIDGLERAVAGESTEKPERAPKG